MEDQPVFEKMEKMPLLESPKVMNIFFTVYTSGDAYIRKNHAIAIGAHGVAASVTYAKKEKLMMIEFLDKENDDSVKINGNGKVRFSLAKFLDYWGIDYKEKARYKMYEKYGAVIVDFNEMV